MNRRWCQLIVTLLMVSAAAGGCAQHDRAVHFAPMPSESSGTGTAPGRIAYETVGRGRKVVAFVHGWTCNRTFWSRQAPALRDDYRLILIDLPGHGQSDAPEDVSYSIPFCAESVKAVLDHAGSRRAVLVGHSLGFSISREVARRHPDRVAALVSADGSPLRPPASDAPSDVEAWRQRIGDFIDRVTKPDPKSARAAFVETMFREGTTAEVRMEVLTGTSQTSDHVAVKAISGLQDVTLWHSDPMELPVLAILSRSENTPADREAQWRRWFPAVEYHEWPEVGHFPMMEAPERFNELLRDFLGRQSWKQD